MELKEFVKGVLTQITDAVKESQEEINLCLTNSEEKDTKLKANHNQNLRNPTWKTTWRS